ncbi:DUF2142 domain-containing protein [Atlantibacter subterraneus]|uniref:DUF2142 domain-containing protein n=1 Tax=Atlantibacter subterraneus TaxID=255519 RepID=UPI002963CDF2|nr:DUF2142 domain-containing protein [Atlantibacter subterranea]MDW2743703.1 DUF2142 domain-containing protein [Atlantibacter subterranea]
MDRLERVSLISYLVVMTIIGIFFVFKNTPLTGLDERFHFFRSYQMAQGTMLPHLINDEKGAWGGCVERKALQYVWPFFVSQDQNQPGSKDDAMKRAAEIDASSDTVSTCFNFAPSATYSPLLYAPSAIGIAITRLVGAGIDAQMYAGRLMNLVFFIAMVYAAVMMMPVLRIPTLMILSFPTLINLASSYSPDPVTNLITLMFIACCLRMAILKEKIFWQTFALACLVGLLKMTNIAFLPFVLLIPASLFSNRNKWLTYMASSIVAGCVVALAWNGYYSWVPSEFWHSGGNIEAAKAALIDSPIGISLFIIKSVIIQTPDMFKGMFATFGGGPQLYSFTADGFYCLLSVSIITASAIVSADKNNAINAARLYLLPILGIGSVVLVFLALWMGFSPLGLGGVAGVQGRYFIISFLTMMLFIMFFVSVSKYFDVISGSTSSIKRDVLALLALSNLVLIANVSYMSIERYITLYK